MIRKLNNEFGRLIFREYYREINDVVQFINGFNVDRNVKYLLISYLLYSLHNPLFVILIFLYILMCLLVGFLL